MGVFEFHSSFWINLHHFLYNEAFRPKAHQESDIAWSEEESRDIGKAVDFYQHTFAGKDLLFDDELLAINNKLAANETNDRLSDLGFPKELVEILERAAPAYRIKIWKYQHQRNQEWIRNVRSRLEKFGPIIQERLQLITGGDFPNTPHRIDVVHEANWAGAYTSRRPSRTVVSSGRVSNQGWSALELVFHELMHAGPFDAINGLVEEEFHRNDWEDRDHLWHAILFFSVGRVTQQVLQEAGIAFTPYAEANGLFSAARSWNRYQPLLEAYWQPYLSAQSELRPSIKVLVQKVVTMAPSPRRSK